MHKSTNIIHTNKTSRSYCTHNQIPDWQVKKNQLLREGKILRWRPGGVSQYTGARRIEATEDEHDSGSSLVETRYRNVGQSQRTSIQLLSWKARELCYDQIGGLRTDPFNALPIPGKGAVPMTWDFLVQHWADIDVADVPKGFDGRPVHDDRYFAALLNDPMLFEVMMAFCMLIQSMHHGELPKLSPEACHHVSNCVAILRSRLTSNGDESTSDIVISTVIVLGAIALTTQDLKSFNFHVKGMQKIIALRGGHKNLGWNGQVAARCRQLEASWLSVQKLENECKANAAGSLNSLIYPRPPFSPELCARFARLTPGFSDLAIRGKISFRLISIIEAITTWDRKTCTNATSTCPMALAGMFLSVPNQTQTETVLAVTFLAYCGFTERRFGRSNPASETALAIYARVLTSDEYDDVIKNQDAFIWALLMLTGTTHPGSAIYQWAHHLLDEIQPTGRKREELGKAFFTISLGN